MSLGSALQIAQNSLLNVTRQTGVVSRNVTDSTNENYTRRQGVVNSNNLGSRVVVVRNGADAQLSLANLQALGDSEAQNVVSARLDQLNISINGVDGSRSPSTLLTKLHGSLQTMSASPSNSLLASAVLQDANNITNSLQNASASINDFRTSIDSEISLEVRKLNQTLDEFHLANTEVVNGTRAGRDVNDALDRRDAALKEISGKVSVNVLSRSDNDVALITKGGATLYETLPRNVTFTPSQMYGAGSAGNPIQIDGVSAQRGQGANTSASGTLAAMVQLRDDQTTSMQAQLDEVARGLIVAFAETDATGGGAPSLAGLFTYAGGPALPPDGSIVPGLASEIHVNSAIDPAQGGNLDFLRNAGANGAAYKQNITDAGSFSDRLISLVQNLDVSNAFDSDSGIGGSMSILSFAAASVAWLDGQRSDATSAASSKTALQVRLSEKMSNQTGVNIDEEMALLLQLEHSYEASARMISTIDEMLSTLMSVVR